MKKKEITLVNEKGNIKVIKKSFSWTVLIFGFIALLIRTQWIEAAIAFFGSFNLMLIGRQLGLESNIITAGITGGYAAYAGIANEQLIKTLQERGYTISND